MYEYAENQTVGVLVTRTELLDALWRDYVAMTPQAERIHAVAGLGIAALAAPFEANGWLVQPDHYRFDDKKLVARYWRHPEPGLPKVFISELCAGELSAAARTIIDRLVGQLPPGFASRADLPWAGRPWQCTRADYDALLVESEYAAWVAAFGLRVNHFTVDVNALTTFDGVAAVNTFLVANGFVLNASGGAIKGTPAERLEQSSTRADSIAVELGGETARLPSCYYEFAKRYPLPDGTLFQGFVPSRNVDVDLDVNLNVIATLDLDVAIEEINPTPRIVPLHCVIVNTRCPRSTELRSSTWSTVAFGISLTSRST